MANFTPGSPAKVDTKREDRGPLLLTAGGRDHTVPATISKQTLRLYRKSPAVTELKEFPERGHSLGHRQRLGGGRGVRARLAEAPGPLISAASARRTPPPKGGAQPASLEVEATGR